MDNDRVRVIFLSTKQFLLQQPTFCKTNLPEASWVSQKIH
jgi:hypothetical protein